MVSRQQAAADVVLLPRRFSAVHRWWNFFIFFCCCCGKLLVCAPNLPLPSGTGGTCDLHTITGRIMALNNNCCLSQGGAGSACQHGSSVCTIDCAMVVLPLLADCRPLLDALYDSTDGTEDGVAIVLDNVYTACLSISNSQALQRLEDLVNQGMCTNDDLNGVALTPVSDTPCVDTNPHCSQVIAFGISCTSLRGQCDVTCNRCGASSGGGHRRAQGTNLNCDTDTFRTSYAQIASVCCDDTGGHCATGVPDTCDAKCAVFYIDFYDRCSSFISAQVGINSAMDVSMHTLYTTCSHSLPTEQLLRLAATCSAAPDCQGGTVLNPDGAARTFSGVYNVGRDECARLTASQSMLDSNDGWCAVDAQNSNGDWYGIDVGGSDVGVRGVVTQCRTNGAPQCVTSYKVQTSQDGAIWSWVDNQAVFPGNNPSSPDARVTSQFTAPVMARFVRVYPVTYDSFTSMRVGLDVCTNTMPALPVQKLITSCSASSEFDSRYSCENVFALANEWAIAGSNNGATPVGSWIQLNFNAAQLVNTLKFAQRSTPTGLDQRSRDLRVEFSDRSTTVVTVADDTLLHSFPLPVTTTTFVKLTIQTTYSAGSSNTGAQLIELWGPPTEIQRPITSCSASSEHDSRFPCENVYDGVVSYPHDWAIAGSNYGVTPVGSWIQLNLAAPTQVNLLKFANRASSATGCRDLLVEFSDGSHTVATAINDNQLHSFVLPLTTTSFVKLTVQTIYLTSDNNLGANEIELWGPVSSATQSTQAAGTLIDGIGGSCDLGTLDERITSLNHVCCFERDPVGTRCATNDACDMNCAVELLPILSECRAVLDAIYDGFDGFEDNTATAFDKTYDSCMLIASADALQRIEVLHDAGRCPNSAMDDVGSTALHIPCQDTLSTCAHVLTLGVPCASLQGQCDNSCHFCHSGGGGRRTLTEHDKPRQRRRTQGTNRNCDVSSFTQSFAQIDSVCCDDEGGQCASGVPTTCDAKCAVFYVPFYDLCDNFIAAQVGPGSIMNRAMDTLHSTCSALPTLPLLQLAAQCNRTI